MKKEEQEIFNILREYKTDEIDIFTCIEIILKLKTKKE